MKIKVLQHRARNKKNIITIECRDFSYILLLLLFFTGRKIMKLMKTNQFKQITLNNTLFVALNILLKIIAIYFYLYGNLYFKQYYVIPVILKYLN